MKCLLYPGQGSQKALMGVSFFDHDTESRKLLQLFSDILEYDFSEVLHSSDPNIYSNTKYSQPILFYYQCALSKYVCKVDVVAAHSMGEYAALVFCGVLNVEDALNIVKNRAEYTAKVCLENETRMAAVIGLPDELIEEVVRDRFNSNRDLFIANYNGSGQVIITGSKEAIKVTCKLCLSLGAKRAVPLPISGAFHSPYMNAADDCLKQLIHGTKFSDARTPLIQSVTGRAHTDAAELKFNLLNHLTSSVQWTTSMANMKLMNVDSTIEVGPDLTLTKMYQRIEPNLMLESIWEADVLRNFADVEFYKNLL